MNSMDVEVIRSAMDWMNRGHRVVLGTVVRTWGSSPRPPGSLMVIRDDGQVAGSLSGGCIEDDLIDRVKRGELAPRLPQPVVYGATAEEAQRFGLPCGGTVQIVLEPLSAGSQLRELLAAIEQHRVTRRRLEMATGLVALLPSSESDMVQFDGQVLQTVHGPRQRLVIIGGGQLSRYLASMAVMLDYRVTVCDPREEYHEGWAAMEGVTLSRVMPDDLVIAMNLDAQQRRGGRHARPQARRPGADGSAEDTGLLRRRPGFTPQQRRAASCGCASSTSAQAEVKNLRGPVGLNLGGARRRRSRWPSWPR